MWYRLAVEFMREGISLWLLKILTYTHECVNSYIDTCTITYIRTLYPGIRILNCKLTFVWQSGWSRKSTLSILYNCYLGSTRSSCRPYQVSTETPATLELHNRIADMQVVMEKGNTAYVIFEGELYVHFHRSCCSQQEWYGTVASQKSSDFCIRVFSPIKCHIESVFTRFREPEFCELDAMMCSYMT